MSNDLSPSFAQYVLTWRKPGKDLETQHIYTPTLLQAQISWLTEEKIPYQLYVQEPKRVE